MKKGNYWTSEEFKKTIRKLKKAQAKLQAAGEARIWCYTREYELGQLDIAIYIVSNLIRELENEVRKG